MSIHRVPIEGKPGLFRNVRNAAPRIEAEAPPPVELAPRRRPRVLFASHDLTLTGAPTILANLVPHLRGLDPVLYSPHDGPLRTRLEHAGIPVTTDFDLAGIDAVVANSLPSAPVVREAYRAGIPSVWLIHESVPEMCGNLPAVLNVIRYPRHVVYPSHATAAAWAGIRRGPVIYSTVPPVPRLPRNILRPFVVLSVGSDEPRKGQADIREAVRDLHGVELVTVSGKEDVHPYYAAADLYVCSSRVEAFPLAIQEAKAHGLPVITTPVYGCAELIRDGIDGLHYQPGDVADLRAKIQRIRTDAELRARLSHPLTHLPQWDKTAAEYERLIHDLTGTGQPGQPVRVVYHSAGGWGAWWREIVTEQFQSLARAGLREVLGTHVGSGGAWVIDEAQRCGLDYTLTHYSTDLTEFEMPAIRLIERIARADNRPVLYLHSKGASHDPEKEPVHHDWRRLMMRELVERWREHLPQLAAHDVVGVNWWRAQPHFSGNIWLARAGWLRKLPRIDVVYRDRYTAERWIGMAPNCRAHSLVCTDRKFWIVGPDQAVMYEALNAPRCAAPPAALG